VERFTDMREDDRQPFQAERLLNQDRSVRDLGQAFIGPRGRADHIGATLLIMALILIWCPKYHS
jgi:hypothetical protein